MSDLSNTAVINVAGEGTTLGRRVNGTFRQFIKKQLTLGVPESISPSTPVFVHARDLVFLGEVRQCLAQVPGEYTLEIAVRQALARM